MVPNRAYERESRFELLRSDISGRKPQFEGRFEGPWYAPSAWTM